MERKIHLYPLGQLRRFSGLSRTLRHQRDHRQASIGFPRVTFTVPTLRRILKTVLPIDAGDSADALKISDQAVAFLIDLRGNVMRNSPGRMTETHAAVKRDGAQPVWLPRISH